MKTKSHRLPLRAVAQVRKSFGIRGELKIVSFARTAEELAELRTMLLGSDEQNVDAAEIEAVTMRGEEIHVKLKGVDDKTAADLLRGKFFFVEESERKTLPKEKFYIDELIGCTVVSASGSEYGTISSVDAYPAQMIYTVRTPNGTVLLPAVREFIMQVDVERKRIVIDPPEGLFEGEML